MAPRIRVAMFARYFPYGGSLAGDAEKSNASRN
jgi:hypothetical protein